MGNVKIKKKIAIFAHAHLSELPHDGDGPTDAVVPDDEGLHTPAPVVPKGEPIEVSPKTFHCDIPTIGAILLK